MFVVVNQINSNAGLDSVSDGEHKNFIGALEPSAAAPATPAPSKSPASSKAGGDANTNGVNNVFYVNFIPGTDTLSSALQTGLTNITSDVNLSSSFISTRAHQQTQASIVAKKLADDGTPKANADQANYTAKVINYLVQHAPWISTTGIQTLQKKFSVEKSAFHQALITNFTQGLSLPSNILAQLEGFLTNVQSTIANSSKAEQSSNIFICIVIYVLDLALQKWVPYVRTIYFAPSQSLTTYTTSGKHSSSTTEVNIDFTYVQTDGMFNEELFVSSVKADLNDAQKKAAKDFANSDAFLDVPI